MSRNSRNLYCLAGTHLLVLFFCAIFTSSILYANGEFTYDAKGKRNPFIPLVTADGRLLKLPENEQGKDISLTGIIYDKHGVSYAIVNGTVVGVGDRIGEYRVLKIIEKKVIFIKDNQIVEFELD